VADLAARIARAREAVAKANMGQLAVSAHDHTDKSFEIRGADVFVDYDDVDHDEQDARAVAIVLAVNALPALLDVAEAGEGLLAYHDGCGVSSSFGDRLRAALAKLKEVL
jgi:hypothetical protein